MDPTGPLISFYAFGLAGIVSGIAVIVFKSPLKSLTAAGVQLLSIFFCLGTQGSWILGCGLLLTLGALYVRSFQFLRAMEPARIRTRHRLRYSQILGLILGLFIGLLMAIQLLGTVPDSIILAWSLFAIGVTGILTRRNAFHFLMSLQMMFNASVFLGLPVNVSNLSYEWVWVLLFAVGICLYWIVGWPFMTNRLLANRSLDVDDAHLLKN